MQRTGGPDLHVLMMKQWDMGPTDKTCNHAVGITLSRWECKHVRAAADDLQQRRRARDGS